MKKKRKHLSQFGVVNQVRSVPVDEGAQSQAILPAEQPRQAEEKEWRERNSVEKRENNHIVRKLKKCFRKAEKGRYIANRGSLTLT